MYCDTTLSKYDHSPAIRLEYYNSINFQDMDCLLDLDPYIRLKGFEVHSYNREICERFRFDYYPELRQRYYNYYGYDDYAKFDNCPIIRQSAYINIGWCRLALIDPDPMIRLQAVSHLNLIITDRQHFDDGVRYEACNQRGYHEKHKHDPYHCIRLGAYNSLGWESDALGDSSSDVRHSAYRNLGWSRNALYDTSENIVKDASEQLGDYLVGWLTNRGISFQTRVQKWFRSQIEFPNNCQSVYQLYLQIRTNYV
jgi:hypothetical protein